jgi:leader peptidase (prepilin peptidase)/N-methyltransferase
LLEFTLAILAGLLIGSFLNACIFRLPRDLSMVQPRSFCPACVEAAEERGVPFEQAAAQSTLSWYELLPVISYVALGGRCRRCKARIPIRYPLVELATAASFAACVAYFGLTLPALKYCAFSAIMIALIVTDFETQILPNEFTLGGAALGLGLAYFVPMPVDFGHLILARLAPDQKMLSLGESGLGAFSASGLIWFTGWLYQKVRHREGLGLGDVKMLATIGAFIGLSASLATMMGAAVLGTIVGLPPGFVAAVRKYRKIAVRRKVRGLPVRASGVRQASATALVCALTQRYAARFHLPFGSFLGVAALGIAAYGEALFQWSRGVPAP